MKNVILKQCQLGLFCLLGVVFLMSCSTDSGSEPSLSDNSKLVGTKWTLINWDYSLGDDYIGLHDETYRFFFYSSTEGAFYYGRKDCYSDQGDSKQRMACHFKYTLSGNTVILDYITDRIISNAVLILDENILRSGELEFSKEIISYSDYSWLNSVHGSTGSCFWYSDMCGKLWIVGDGVMANYSSYEATPWAKSNRTPNSVIVDEGVKTIGSYAFADVSITSVELPEESLTRISDYAFKGSLIKEVWIGDNTTYIGTEAFANCTKLKDINIPKSLKEVGDYAFSGCTALNEFKIEFGEELRTIGEYAFEGGEASYLIFNEGLQSISTGAFIGDYCGISKELVLPNSLGTIGATAFEGTYKKIVLGTGIESIGEKAFISGATSGVMYVNLSTPPATGTNIIVERSKWSPAESRWTLYVPKGCKSTYSNKSPWNKFKSIIEDSSLEGGSINGENNGANEDYEDFYTGTVNGYEYVDLGLSVKWATCNIGAERMEEVGDYYAWGEIEPKSMYKPDNSNTFLKDLFDISGNVQYDAARANWGGLWRLPTLDEFEELCDNCLWEWLSINGIYGVKMISKKNAKSIFIPAGGDREGTMVYYKNEYCYYWSSTPGTSNKIAGGPMIKKESEYLVHRWGDRYCGRNVRPVIDL